MDIISRKEAGGKGLQFYFTGKQCIRGHVCCRYVSTRMCVECRSDQGRKWREDNHNHHLEYNRKYYLDNRERICDRTNQYNKDNAEEKRKRDKEWQKNNPEKTFGYQTSWRKKNLHKDTAKSAKRRSMKLDRTLDINEQGQSDIEHIYQQASLLRYLGYDYHVDHIVPLQGEVVSGLHVPWNLQVIPAKENLTKSNNFTPVIEIY